VKLPVADLLAAKDENGVSVDRPPQLRDGVVVNGSAGIEPADLGADMRMQWRDREGHGASPSSGE